MRTLKTLVVLIALLMANGSYAFELLVKPVKSEYAIGEPIGVEFVIKNISNKDIELWTRPYSEYFGVTFQSDAVARLKKKDNDEIDLSTIDGLKTCKIIKHGDVIKSIRYINVNGLRFVAPGNYNIHYDLNLNYRVQSNDGSEVRNVFKKMDSFLVTVTEKRFEKADIAEIIDRFDGSSHVEREIIEALSTIEQEFVIPLLVKQGRDFPCFSQRIALALAKFVPLKKGLDAMEQLAAEFASDDLFMMDEQIFKKEQGYGVSTVTAAYSIFFKREVIPSIEFIKSQLRSKNDMRVLLALDYLLRARQRLNDAPLDQIEKLTESNNEDISKVARKIYEATSKAKSKDDF